MASGRRVINEVSRRRERTGTRDQSTQFRRIIDSILGKTTIARDEESKRSISKFPPSIGINFPNDRGLSKRPIFAWTIDAKQFYYLLAYLRPPRKITLD